MAPVGDVRRLHGSAWSVCLCCFADVEEHRRRERCRTSLRNRVGGAEVKGGPSGPAEGSPEGATLTDGTPTRSCERVRLPKGMRARSMHEGAKAFTADECFVADGSSGQARPRTTAFAAKRSPIAGGAEHRVVAEGLVSLGRVGE